MSAAFTPGPWAVRDQPWGTGGKHYIVRKGGPVVATTLSQQSSDPAKKAQVEANANLIAAAPDLYEALDDMIELARPNIYPQPDKPDSPYGRLERARLVLAKARGEQSL